MKKIYIVLNVIAFVWICGPQNTLLQWQVMALMPTINIEEMGSQVIYNPILNPTQEAFRSLCFIHPITLQVTPTQSRNLM